MVRARKQQPQQTSRTEVLPVSPAPAPPSASTAQAPAPGREPSPAPSPAALPSSLAGATWQGILFLSDRPFVRLVSAQAEWQPAEGDPAAVGQLSLHFSRVVPAGAAAATSADAGGPAQPACEPLRLPVDERFAEQSLRVQVFGRQPNGGSFAAPHAFRAQGRDLAAALGVQRQWQEYQQRHREARTTAGQPVSAANFAHSSTLAVQSGDGLERLQAIFDVAGGAWLKGIVCRFLVAEASEPQPGATEPVNGRSSSGVGATEQGGAAAAQAGAHAVAAAAGMAAPLAAAGSEHEPSSWLAAKQQRQLHEQRQRQRPPADQQARPQEAQEQPAAPVPKGPAPAAATAQGGSRGAEADGAVRQHPTTAPKDGKTKRPGSRQAARKPSHGPAAPAAGAGSGSQQADLASPPAGGSQGGAVDQPMHAAGSRGCSAASNACLSSTASSTTAPAGQPPSPPAPRRSKAAAGAKQAAQPAGEHAAGGLASAAGKATGGSRSRSRSSGRAQHNGGQEASMVRRHPKLFPGVDQQAQAQPSGSSSLQALPERSRQPGSGPTAPASPRSAGQPHPGSEQQLAASAAGPASSSHAGLGRGRRGAPAARGEAAPAAGSPATVASAAAPSAAVPATPLPAGPSQQPPRVGQLSEAQPLGAGLPDRPPSVAAACACGCGHPSAAPAQPKFGGGGGAPWLAKHPALSSASPVWQGTADSADVAAEAAASAAQAATPDGCQQPVWQGAADSADVAAEAAASAAAGDGSGVSSRPSSPAEGEWSEGSEGSEGSRASRLSWQSSDGYFLPSRPSDWGLSYNYGHPCPLPFTMFDHQTAGVALPGHGQHVLSAPAQKPAPLSEAVFRPGRRSTGSFAASSSSRSASLAGSSGSGFYAMPMPLHHSAASMPLLPLPAYHQRSGSSGSISSQGSGDGGSAAPPPAPAAAYWPAEHHWQMLALNSWAEPFVPPAHHQPYIQLHVRPVQPSPFMPRMQAVPARPQWAQQQHPHMQQRLNAAEPAAEAFWQLHRRSGSSSGSGWQQHAEAALQYKQQVQHASGRGAGAHGGGTAFSSSGHLGSPLPSSALTPRSTPSSAATSPMPSRGPLRGMPTSTPPPPPLTVPAVDLQVLESAEDGPDLERFLQAATPQVVPPPSGLQDLTLADLWRWYEGPSTVGCEVATIGGPRGPATAYYLPYLSAVQLFVPATANDEAAVAAAVAAAAAQPGDGSPGSGQPPPQLLSYPNGLDSWPERMRPAVQWGEAANMRDRVPLHSRLLDLCGQGGEEHPLMATRIADLHPFSWFAVAWYPLYCVPEAPLSARFLTFHTLASLWEAASEAAAKCRQRQEAALAAAAAEAQRQWLQAAARHAAAEAAARDGEAHAAAGATTPRSAAGGSPGLQASPGGASPGRALPSRPSYKSMLEAGLPASDQPAMPVTVTYTATPTAVCSFPGSPTCSDAGTRTTLDTGSSRAHSVDGSGGAGGGPASVPGRSRLALSSGAESLPPASSVGGGSSSGHPTSLSASEVSSAPPSPPASVAGDAAEPLPVPVAGLAWYATGRDENWTETLVAAQLPPGVSPAPSAALAGGARLLGSWRGVAVLARPYPVAKGGPLGWEIQQEEMAQCAERLAAGAGLVALRPRAPRAGAAGGASVEWERHGRLPPAALGVACPDYEFFAARAARYC
ncbi:hypothetical protein ABPG75_005392 [Micractinium tetrahymenae]